MTCKICAFALVLSIFATTMQQTAFSQESKLPRNDSPIVQISPDNEPGQTLVIRGTVFDSDGSTPLPDIAVHVYHTDITGRYDAPGTPQGSIRLKADLVTDANGNFAFRTIKPASYPSGDAPAHIHFSAQRIGESTVEWFNLLFLDDPMVGDRERAKSERLGMFGSVIRLAEDGDGVLVGEFNIRLK